MERDAFREGAFALGVSLAGAQLDAFEQFEEGLYAANEVMNLTSVPREDCWLRHFLDSLLIQSLIPPGASVLDIGSGPGFPAWPLACARPDLQITALDSSGKMIGFLMRNELSNLEVVQGRAETWGRREAFDFITGRAVAPLGIQLELSAPSCRVGGLVVPMRTPADRLGIESFSGRGLGLRLDRIEERVLPGTDIVRLLPVFVKEWRTDIQYPRPWAVIKRTPL